jgi:hypothetical protein
MYATELQYSLTIYSWYMLSTFGSDVFQGVILLHLMMPALFQGFREIPM